MVSEQHQTGLLVAVPIYFLLLAGCAYWAHRRMERMEHDKVADKLSAHYLGGRDFGPLMTAGTIFASLFSGYTVIGVPNEAYNTGWAALQWMSTIWGEFSISIALLRYGMLYQTANLLLLLCQQSYGAISELDFVFAKHLTSVTTKVQSTSLPTASNLSF
jgi:Na+/proline symporter